MENNYSILKQIIVLFEEYETEEQQLNLIDFAYWIITKLNEEPDLIIKTESRKDTIRHSEKQTLLNNLTQKARFLESLTRIARYHEFYIRKALQDLNINSRLEFHFLQSVNILDKAKKTDLINIHLLEYTTGMDTIRRLIKNGLLYEMQDKTDKRAKLLVLTEPGMNVLKLAEKRINEENEMFFSIISDNKWKKALPLMEEIDHFHHSIYLKHNDKSFAEICNLMGSLKHLYK